MSPPAYVTELVSESRVVLRIPSPLFGVKDGFTLRKILEVEGVTCMDPRIPTIN